MHPDHEVEKLISAARHDAFHEAASVDAKVIAILMAAGKVSREDVDVALAKVAALTTPQPTTQFEAWAKLRHFDLVRCSHEPYAAYRSDLTNAALAGWRGGNGGAAQSNHYQQLLGVAYVVLGCLAANGVDIPVRFLDAFSDPDSVENPLELLPCDFSPARAVRAAVVAAQAPIAWMRVTDITEWADTEPESDGWTPLYATPTTPTGLVTPASLSTDATAQLSTDSVDKAVEMVRRLVHEFGDYHYHTCPQDVIPPTGPCECFAGALMNDARALLAAPKESEC